MQVSKEHYKNNQSLIISRGAKNLKIIVFPDTFLLFYNKSKKELLFQMSHFG
jgi:hypothetical protein